MVEYACVEGYYLSGDAVAECTENQSWRRGAMICKSTSSVVSPSRTFQIQHKHSAGFSLILGSTCGVPLPDSQVVATPTKATYEIGETVSLSCPAGSVLEGEVSEVRCTSSLQWSPSPSTTSCVAGKTHCFSSWSAGLQIQKTEVVSVWTWSLQGHCSESTKLRWFGTKMAHFLQPRSLKTMQTFPCQEVRPFLKQRTQFQHHLLLHRHHSNEFILNVFVAAIVPHLMLAL